MLKLLDLSERTIVLLLFGLFCWSNLKALELYNLPILLTELLTVVFILTRRQTDAVSRSPADWALTLIGTTAALLARPGGEPLNLTAGTTLLVVGVCITIAAKASLNRSFGLAPANRGIKRRGAYAFLRHPMYLGHMV